MKKFKVRERYISEVWTYVKAETKEQAQKLLEEGHEDYTNEIDYTHEETDWSTFQEVE